MAALVTTRQAQEPVSFPGVATGLNGRVDTRRPGPPLTPQLSSATRSGIVWDHYEHYARRFGNVHIHDHPTLRGLERLTDIVHLAPHLLLP